MPNEISPVFSGKVVRVLLNGPDARWQWWSLDEPIVESQHGRLFLVGRMTRPEPGRPYWGDTVTVCIPWDSISLYLVESMDDRLSRKLGGPEVNTMPE
jgi:hypothetical protein